MAEEYLEKTKISHGVFLIPVGRAQAPVWDVSPHHHLEWKKPMPFVNNYSFHIVDRDWGMGPSRSVGIVHFLRKSFSTVMNM